jgi:hypothetical protein
MNKTTDLFTRQPIKKLPSTLAGISPKKMSGPEEERDEYMRQRPAAISWYYCDEHTTKNAVLLKDVNFGELKCGKCGADAEYREYK